jgi:hypothetical protein
MTYYGAPLDGLRGNILCGGGTQKIAMKKLGPVFMCRIKPQGGNIFGGLRQGDR